MKLELTLSLVVALAAGAGCQRKEPPAQEPAAEAPAEEATEATPEPESPGKVGTVRGVVRLAEGATLPSYDPSRMGAEATPNTRVEDCAPPTAEDRQPVKMGARRALTGVMVSATGDRTTFFDSLPTYSPTERRVEIVDCRLSPQLVVGVRGDRLVIQNSTRAPFFPVVGRAAYADSLVFGQSRSVELARGGVDAITCALSPGCGRTDLVVVMNPVFDVTGEEGRFEMTNVPADQDVVIHAWHPLFDEVRAEARVEEGGETEVELVLRPLGTTPRAARPAAPAPSDSEETP